MGRSPNEGNSHVPLRPLPVLLVLSLSVDTTLADIAPPAHDLSDTMTVFRHALGIPTMQGQRQVPALAAYLADQLKTGGFDAGDVEVIPIGETAAPLVTHYRGTSQGKSVRKPIYLSGHMDVAPAKRRD